MNHSREEQRHSRPYRSKRHRPCDVCRRRKHGCTLSGRPGEPCIVCQKLGTACTFNDAPKKRTSTAGSLHPVAQPLDSSGLLHQDRGISYNADDGAGRLPSSTSVQVHEQFDADSVPSSAQFSSLDTNDADMNLVNSIASQEDFWHVAPSFLDANFGLFPPAHPEPDGWNTSTEMHWTLNAGPNVIQAPQQTAMPYQPLRAINPELAKISGHDKTNAARPLETADHKRVDHYSLLSGEMDSSLLQNMRFSEDGTCDFGRFAYRSMSSHQPVHFMIYSGRETKRADREADMATLEKLVPFEIGARLVGLFFRYVFPSLPVVSRKLFEVKAETLLSPVSVLRKIPAYLLAAIYGIAETFRRYDAVLCVSHVDTELPQREIWQMVHDGITREMQQPSLHLMQALLIYIQRQLGAAISPLTADDPGDWPLLGVAVNLATQLGLNMDCSKWPIPAYEKRLRRRLWWILYSETSWRSLMLGTPGYLHDDDWDVLPLNEADFQMDELVNGTEETSRHAPTIPGPCPYCHLGHEFKYMASLSIIARDTFASLYTVRSQKRMTDDPAAAKAIISALLDRLVAWKSQAPKGLLPENVSDIDCRPYFHSASGAHLKLATLTVEAMIYRSAWRPMTRKGEAIPNMTSPLSDGAGAPFAHSTIADSNPEIVQSSVDLANRILAFVQRLDAYDRNSFAYYWASACFAAMSNYIVLVLVQAPTASTASEVMKIFVRWVITLRDQSVTFAFIRLGLLRLDSILSRGLEEAFHLSDHVKQALLDD